MAEHASSRCCGEGANVTQILRLSRRGGSIAAVWTAAAHLRGYVLDCVKLVFDFDRGMPSGIGHRRLSH
jgi:hypothetical protein